MGTSTDGQICFGIYFEEGYDFPWSDHDDIEDWWIKETGWAGESPYTPEGEYAEGYSSGDPRIDFYFDSRMEWLESHPLPVVEVNYQSGDCPAYILAVPDPALKANRGYPQAFSPEDLKVNPEDVKSLIEFCENYHLEHDTPPSWYLSSYWG